jgi:anhydro-N-acetylmuramic acid kinase
MDPALYIGLMSGTSLDGIDVALVDFGDGAKLVAKAHHPMPALLTAILLQMSQSNAAVSLEQVGHLDTALGQAFADAVTAFIARHGIDPRQVRAIGSHGQTVRHNPHGEQPFSLQLGDANIIAERTGITTVADFRRRDVAAGGQGAPLVPAFHRSLFPGSGENLAVINIGGIANITFLPASGPVTGFDTGPGNGLMDAWCQRHWQIAYDDKGAKAALGTVDDRLLERLLSDPWLHLPPPKSTGRDVFQLDWLDQQLQGFALPPETVLRTLNAFTAHSIASAVLAPVDAVYVCGGGVHNALLMKRLKELLPCPCMSTADVGVDPDFVEAMAFAWLAKQCLQGKPGNLVEVTGAAGPRVLGAIYQA